MFDVLSLVWALQGVSCQRNWQRPGQSGLVEAGRTIQPKISNITPGLTNLPFGELGDLDHLLPPTQKKLPKPFRMKIVTIFSSIAFVR